MREVLNFNTIILINISLFPMFLITGPFLSDLFCIILGLIFIFYIFKQKFFFEFKDNYYFYFFITFYFYLILNSVLSFDPKISFASSIPFIRIILFIFALSFFIKKNNKIYKYFYLVFFACILFLFIDSIIQFFLRINIFTSQEVHINRISSFFGDELIMGSYVARVLPIVLAISLLTNLKKRYILNIIILSLSGFLILVSGERLAIFYYFGIVLAYFLLVKRNFLVFMSIIIISIFIGHSLKPNMFDRFYGNTLSQINEINSIFSYRHTLHYVTAYQMFLDQKFLGHGLKSFRYKCSDIKYENFIKIKKKKDKKILREKNFTKFNYIDEYKNGCNTHPHNIYLEYLSELGLLGVIFLIVIFLYSIIKFIKNSYKNIISFKVHELNVARSLILTGIILQLFPLVPSGSYFNNWMMIIFHLSIGFYLSLSKEK